MQQRLQRLQRLHSLRPLKLPSNLKLPQQQWFFFFFFFPWKTLTHERLFNCILTPSVEVLDTIQRPTVAGMKLWICTWIFSVFLFFFPVRWCLNGASVHRLAECYQPADQGWTATMAASEPFKHENISFLPGFYRFIMLLGADNSVHNELKCFHSLSLQYNLIAVLVIEPLC